jgi:hypothetical protein
MKILQVVRIEHPEVGKGMFTHKRPENLKSLYKRHSDSFPTPYTDKGINYFDGDWFCAYKTLEQFNQWVTHEEVNILLNLGFRIYLLDLNSYQIGEFQVVFKKEGIISKKDISELFV